MELTMEALKRLYKALGGDAQNVKDCRTNVDALNAISAKYGGASDAILNAEAIENIAAVADRIGGGNPNRVQVIEGTAGNPWPGLDAVEFWNALNNNNATAEITCTYMGGTVTAPLRAEGVLAWSSIPPGVIVASTFITQGTMETCNGVHVVWEPLIQIDINTYTPFWDGSVLLEPSFLLNVGDVKELSTDREFVEAPTTTTIIWHPLPEGQEG